MALSSQQLLFSSQFSLLCPRTPPNRNFKVIPRAALREWKEYEDAVKRKDLARALRVLKSKETLTNNDSLADSVNGSFINDSATRSGFGGLGLFDGLERDWEVLDTCLNADDMRLVSSAYGFLKNRGFLPSFGKFSNIGRVDHQQLEYEGSLAGILFLMRSLAFNLLNFHFDMFAYSVGLANAKSIISSRNSRLADLMSGLNIENSIPALCFYYALCV